MKDSVAWPYASPQNYTHELDSIYRTTERKRANLDPQFLDDTQALVEEHQEKKD